MKTLRHLSLLIMFCCAFASSKAQWVTIPDTAFASFLRTKFPTCLSGNQMDTTCAQIITARELRCSHLNIKDLTGVQYFDTLGILVCSNNALSWLPPLPPTVFLLDCGYNLFTNVPSLPPYLTNLNIDSNSVTNLPALLPQTILILMTRFNQLGSVPPLPPSLFYFECGYNKIDSLPQLPNSLIKLGCYNNRLTTLPALPPNLQELICQHNNLDSLPTLPASITVLAFEVNRVRFIPAIPPLLQRLYCSYNQLTRLPAFPATLTYLECNNNMLDSLPNFPPHLNYVNAIDNRITEIPTLPQGIYNLACRKNLLTKLPVLPSSLRSLDVSDNLISSIPELPDTLTGFTCNNNPNLYCLPALKTIDYFRFDSARITCVSSYGNVAYSYPQLQNVPLCQFGNTGGCAVAANISGRIYNDTSADCALQIGEESVAFLKIKLLQNNNVVQQGYSGGYGVYSFWANTGNYTLTVDTTGLPFTILCPAGQYDSATVIGNAMSGSNNFALQCKPGYDIAAWSIVTKKEFRPAAYVVVKVSAGDQALQWKQHCNTANLSGQLVLTISGPAHYVSPAPGALTPTTIAGNVITYNISNWSGVDPLFDFNIVVQCDTGAQAGQQVCLDVQVTPYTADNDTSNNHLSQCYMVFNSYDPNDKQVSPVDNINNTAQWLTYTIRFQNTGNAPAIHIYVIDTLDAALDINSFELLAYSHQPVVNIYNDMRYARFTFPNINLADSVSNEPESHGYIQYRIRTLPGLNCGTQIGNAAHIYFDFNPPVATNAALNRIYMSSTTNLQNTICNGEQFNFNGQALTVPGNYTDTLQAAYACDSIITLQLAVVSAFEEFQNATVCHGETYNWRNRSLSATGMYADTLQTATSCDSIITLQLQVLPSYSQTESATVCNGETFNWRNLALTAAGNYADTLQASSSCDSIVTLQLQVLQGAEVSESASICDGETYNWRNRSLTARDTYTDTLQTTTGCDSVLILNLEVYTGYSAVVDTAILSGTSLVLPSGTAVTAPGNYTDTLQSIFGCDSIIITRLSVISGIENLASNAAMQLYPNPANDVVMINLSDNLTGGTLTLSDVTGRSLNTIPITSKHNQLNTGALSSGVYLVTAVKDGVRVVQRLTISQ